MQHVAENLCKEERKTRKKEDNLRDDFRRRLANKKKSRRFIQRWRMLRKLNKKTYDFFKKRSEEDKKMTIKSLLILFRGHKLMMEDIDGV
jgi:hypothetical protein